MFEIMKGSVQGYQDIPVHFQLIKQKEKSNSLAVMLPGKGYTVQGPLFHYSTGIFLNKGFDVLHINYDYTNPQSKSMSLEEGIQQIKVDVNTVLDHIFEDHLYVKHTLIGKSIGTIALSAIVDREEFREAKIIWLTPLLQLDTVYEKMLATTQKGLCIIGDKDPCFIRGKFEKLSIMDNMDSLLIPDTEHSLNYPDRPVESIDVLKKVMTEVSKF